MSRGVGAASLFAAACALGFASACVSFDSVDDYCATHHCADAGVDGSEGDAGTDAGAHDDGGVKDAGGGGEIDGGGGVDAGGGEMDAGGGPVDAGGGEMDAGGGPVDAGGGELDAGGGEVDAGGGMVDAGGGMVDAGGGMVDAGGGMVDAGGGMVDAGGGMVDAGGGMVDAGGGMTDAGSASDAGPGIFAGELGSNGVALHPAVDVNEDLVALKHRANEPMVAAVSWDTVSPATGAPNFSTVPAGAVMGRENQDLTGSSFIDLYGVELHGDGGYYVAGSFATNLTWAMNSASASGGQRGFIAYSAGDGGHTLVAFPSANTGTSIRDVVEDVANNRVVALGTIAMGGAYTQADGGTVTTVGDGAMIEFLNPTTLARTKTLPTVCNTSGAVILPRKVGITASGIIAFDGTYKLPSGTCRPFGPAFQSLPQATVSSVFLTWFDGAATTLWYIFPPTGGDQTLIDTRVTGDLARLVYVDDVSGETIFGEFDMTPNATQKLRKLFDLTLSLDVSILAFDVDSADEVWVGGSYRNASATICGHTLPAPQGDDGFVVNCGTSLSNFTNGVGMATWRGAGTQWVKSISAVSPTDVYVGGTIQGATEVNAPNGVIAGTNGGRDVLIVHYDH